MKTQAIAKGIDATFDETDELTAEFAGLFVASKKIDHVSNPSPRGDLMKRSDRFHEEVERIESKPGFVGCGSWVFQFKGERFAVRGHANGRGFWGTSYHVEKVAPVAQES
jgi:hypothetical protein